MFSGLSGVGEAQIYGMGNVKGRDDKHLQSQ